ncbi:his operon leader peptide, partial [Staphylococcus aureus]
MTRVQFKHHHHHH